MSPPPHPSPPICLKKKKNPQCLFRGLFISENNTCGNTYFNFTILFIQELKPILQYVQSHPGPSSPSPWVHRHNNPILHRSSCPLKWYCNKFLSLTPCAFSHNFSSPCPQFFCLLPTACIVVLQFVNVKAAEGVPFTLHPYKPETDKKWQLKHGNLMNDQLANLFMWFQGVLGIALSHLDKRVV